VIDQQLTTKSINCSMEYLIIIIMLSSDYSYIMDFYTEECTVYRSDRTAYWVGVRKFILLHCAFGVFGVFGVCIFNLLRARIICLELWIENVFPRTCFAHCLGVCA